MSFSTSLKKVGKRLTYKYGNTGVLTEVIVGAYNPTTGEADKTTVDVDVKYQKEFYTTDEIESGLYGIDDFRAIISYDKDIQKSWLLDGAEIVNVRISQAQDLTIIQELQCRK